jgi:hypothetical protein
MKNSKIDVKKWTGNEKLDWGVAKVEFFIKDEKILFGNLKVPAKSNTQLDEGHPSGEYAFIKEGEATIILSKDNNQITQLEVKKGQAILIPEKLDHQWVNSSDSELSIIFFIQL